MVSGTQCPYVSSCGCEVVRGAAAPKGQMTYAFTHRGNFSNSSSFFSFSVHSLRISYPSLEAQIPALRLTSQSGGSYPSYNKNNNRDYYESPESPFPYAAESKDKVG